MQNKEEPWQTTLRLLKEISEDLGFNPETGEFEKKEIYFIDKNEKTKKGKIIFSVSLDKELFQKLEDQRGPVSRPIYVESLLKKHLADQDNKEKKKTIEDKELNPEVQELLAGLDKLTKWIKNQKEKNKK